MERTKQYRCDCLTAKGHPCRQAGGYRLEDGRVVCARHWAMLRQGHTLTFRPGGAAR